MAFYDNFLNNLPEVAKPTQRRLSFKEKLKWTLIILVVFYVLGLIPLFGLGDNSLQQFEILSIILGAQFGSILSLGIGPIVTASIVLQLLTGSGILKLDLTTDEGKKRFQGIQKVASMFFILFEASVYVFMGGLAPNPDLFGTGIYTQIQLLLVFQLFLGGMLILFMDEVVSKWGFGSGISLFIVAGVSKSIFIKSFSPFTNTGVLAYGTGEAPVGVIPAIFHFLPLGGVTDVLLAISAILATVLVFVISVYAQAMKVEVPLSFGRIRGQGIRWPLSFIYTSNIPVILVAALMANMQLWARLLEKWGHPFLGTFSGNAPASGAVLWFSAPRIVEKLIKGGLTGMDVSRAFIYMLFMIVGAVIFSIFWVQTAGMDARSQAKQMMASGLQIPGFRKDQRVLERLLERYIGPLTVMGAIAVGFLAAIADLAGALSYGTGILLSVMIVYKLYEEIAQQHMLDMNPMLRQFMGKGI